MRKLNFINEILIGILDFIAFYFCTHFLKYIFVNRLFFLFFYLLFQLSVLLFRNSFNFCNTEVVSVSSSSAFGSNVTLFLSIVSSCSSACCSGKRKDSTGSVVTVFFSSSVILSTLR